MNTLEKREQGLEFANFLAEKASSAKEGKCESRERRESSKKFFNSAGPLFIGPGRGSFAKCASI
jgi:hypothetical protein